MTDEAALSAEDFRAFFLAIWGAEPFPWQQRLISELAVGRPDGCPWPDALKLPTGSGKTAALDIAVFHLALEAGRGELRRAPVRIAYVVDRRLIVDDTFARAKRLCLALRLSLLDQAAAEAFDEKEPALSRMALRVRDEPIVRRIAQRLRLLAGENAPPLLARALRGGAPREDDWARTPAQPTILCSTVDQVGSRLLFRGYGVSDRMRPIHAGLLGSDCLILLDEAHLSEPFRQTLSAIECLPRPDKAPFGFAVLSATPAFEAKHPFDLDEEDAKHPVFAPRLRAKKPARLVEIMGKQGVDTESRRADAIAEATKEVLEALQCNPVGNPAIGVVVNRVARARAAYERLRQALPEKDYDLMLLIGPARSIDRDEHARRLDAIRTGRDESREKMDKPLIVVATQTIEAGVDIDFDGLVTEAAAFDALRQRFGRLNRGAREKIKPQAIVLAHKEDIGKKANDPVYGDRIAATWNALQRWQKDEYVDFGIDAMNGLLETEDASVLKTLMTEPGNAPVLMSAYTRLWSQTCVIPRNARKGAAHKPPKPVEPEIDLFLHGDERAAANVQIVWRADLPSLDFEAASQGESLREKLIELLGLLPPRSAEAIEVPIKAARAWLRQVKAPDFSDIVELAADEDESGRGRLAFRYAGAESERTQVVFSQDLRPGDLIVVPSAYGGCDEWGWSPDRRDAVIDVAADAAQPYRRRRFAVRVTPALIAQGLRTEKKKDDALAELEIDEATIAENLGKCIAESDGPPNAMLEAILGLKRLPDALRQDLESLRKPYEDSARRVGPRAGRKDRQVRTFSYDDDDAGLLGGIVFFARAGLEVEGEAIAIQEEGAAVPSTEADDFNTMFDGSISLEQHSADVADWADFFAEASGLDADRRHDVTLAAFLHDLGKSDPRYQAYYAGGDPYGSEAGDVLAKSGKRLSLEAWARAGLPSHWRHEAASVCEAMDHPAFKSAKDPALVLWLIGTHHGFGRPHFPHASEGNRTGPQSLAFRFKQMDWASLFADLQQRYGIWGLARLEAFVRLADHRGSDLTLSPPKREAEPWASRFDGKAEFAGIVADPEPSTRLRLEGLEPDNLLAFLCLLGTLRAIEDARPEWQPRVAWSLDQPPLRPILCLAQSQEESTICEAAAEGVSRLAAAYRFPADAAPDAPAQKDLNYSPETARKLLEQAATGKNTDVWSALMCDAAHKDEKIEATPFCLLFGQGHQHFLDRLAEVPRIEAPPPRRRDKKTVTLTAAETLHEALFQPWVRQDPTPAFRWDPTEDVRYALRAADPSGDKSTTQHGANRLAAIGLAALPAVPIRRGDRIRLQVPGGRFERTEFRFSWPIWDHSAGLSTICALLAHPGLIEENISTLAPLGVVGGYRTRRISVGKFMNFTRAETIMISI